MPADAKKKREVNTRAQRAGFWRVLWGLVFFLGVLAVLYVHIVVWPVRFTPGQVVPYDIIAPMAAEYLDTTALSKLQAEGPASIIDTRVKETVLLNLSDFFSELRATRLEVKEPAQQVERLAASYPVPSDAIALLLTHSDEDLADIESYARETLSDLMQEPWSAETIKELRRQTEENTAATLRDSLPTFFLRENITEAPDVPEVQEFILKGVTHKISKGEIILGAGSVVTQVTLDKLAAVEEGMVRQRTYKFYGLALLQMALMLVWFVHLWFYKRKIFNNPSIWGQLTIVLIMALAVSLIVGRLPFKYVHYAVPLATAAAVMLIVTMYDAILASYVGLGIAVVTALALNYNSNLAVYILISTTYPVVFLNQRSSTRDLAVFGLNLGLLNVVLAVAVFLFSVEAFSWWALSYALLAGIAAATLALGVTPVLETFSSQLTPAKLQALINPEMPLLKRLLDEAPGTYMHSMVMASMSEEACNDIGANGLLAKVGSMYHDIGKLKRPGFYAENIGDPANNPHKHLPPESSFNIIVQHIQDGMEIGRKAGLPEGVLAFIPEHHGTTKMKFFLEEARKRSEAEGSTFNPDHFRYGGPDPQSKETAVVMLADSCEAKVRAMDTFTEEEVRLTVRENIQEKQRHGHLDASGLTIGDLHTVEEAFTSVLVNLHHSRLKYPEQEKADAGDSAEPAGADESPEGSREAT